MSLADLVPAILVTKMPRRATPALSETERHQRKLASQRKWRRKNREVANAKRRAYYRRNGH